LLHEQEASTIVHNKHAVVSKVFVKKSCMILKSRKRSLEVFVLEVFVLEVFVQPKVDIQIKAKPQIR
jgi:hypothetical protein